MENNNFKKGVKQAFKEMRIEKARALDLEWMNDYNNTDKFKKAVKAWELVG